MAKYNVGVIGVGYWGRKIVDEYTKVEDVALVGVSDLEEKNLQFCAERYGVKNGFTDYRKLLALKDLNAVNICTPNQMHYRITKEALEAGKHVLVEKPITLNSKEGRELVELAQKKKLTLSVGHIFRFNNALHEVRRLIKEENYFGKLYLIECNWLNLEKAFPIGTSCSISRPTCSTFRITSPTDGPWRSAAPAAPSEERRARRLRTSRPSSRTE